jgi:MerR family mercuric resistance operon transcriptional regulator
VEHVADIRRKVRDLKRLERVLDELAARCHGKEMPECPILDALSAAPGAMTSRGIGSGALGRSRRR